MSILNKLGNYHYNDISLTEVNYPTQTKNIRVGWLLQLVGPQGMTTHLMEWDRVLELHKFLTLVIEEKRGPKLV